MSQTEPSPKGHFYIDFSSKKWYTRTSKKNENKKQQKTTKNREENNVKCNRSNSTIWKKSTI